jgi:hypothetical protein
VAVDVVEKVNAPVFFGYSRHIQDQDFLAKDPAGSIKTPSNLRESDKTTLTWDQLRSALAKLGLRDRILLKLDMTHALRPSEPFPVERSESEPSSRGARPNFHTQLRCSGFEALRDVSGDPYLQASARSDDTRATGRLASQAI